MIYSTRTLGQLVRWDGNPRPPATPEARAELRASIAEKGLIAPIIVRHASGPKKGDKRIDEILGGGTRHEILKELHAEGGWPTDREIHVIVRDDLIGDDVGALDLALSDNIYVPVHPMDQFYAFNQMVEMGREIQQIANAYGVSVRVVEQRLSYAKLDDRARRLVKDDVRDLEWAAAMTMASPDEQSAMLDEMDADSRRYLSAHDVRRRLEDELVPTTNALFDVAGMEDVLVRRDLFDPAGASYIKRSEFQPLQDAAVADLVAVRRAEGWSNVSVVSERDFDRFRYEDGVADRSRAEVILVRHASGAVKEHAGLALRTEERINLVSAEDEEAGSALFGENSGGAAAARAAESRDPRVDEGRKTQRHIAVSRAVIVQAILMEDARLATAVLLAGLLSPAAPRTLEGRMFGDMKEVDPANPARIIVERRLDAARQIMESGGIDATLEYGELVDALLALDDAQTATLLQVAIAKRVTTDMQRGDMLFDAAMAQDGVLLQTYWRPDRTYLATLSKDAIEKIARQALPVRMLGKITGSKNDVVETLAQIFDDAHEDATRFGEAERLVATSWAPASLGGAREETLFDPADDDDTGSALFGGPADDADDMQDVDREETVEG